MDDANYLLMWLMFGAIALFVAVPAFWRWYFEMDKLIRLLESIDESLAMLPAVRSQKRRTAQPKEIA